MAVNFAEEVQRYGSVEAAREALGFTQNADGAWQAPADVEQRAAESAAANSVAAKANTNPIYQGAYQAAQSGDWDGAARFTNQLAVDAGYGDGSTINKDGDAYLHALMKEFGYNANDYYRGLYDAVYGAGAWDGGTGTGQPVYNDFSAALVQKYNNAQNPSAPAVGVDSEALTVALNSLMGKTPSPSMNAASVQYAAAPEYAGSQWDSVLNALAQQLIGMNYEDWTKGDQYRALANRYGQQGKMSMQDVLGQISGRTGGLASSWAQTAAQQQYNGFMSQLEDAAMEMYGVEQGDLLDKANLARQYANDDYNRYLNELDQWNADRSFNYNAAMDASAQEKSDLMAIAETLASFGDFSGYKALGYTDDQIANMTSGYRAQQAAKNKSTVKEEDTGTKMTLSTAKAMMDEGQFTDAAVQTMLDAGYNVEYLQSVYGYDPNGDGGDSPAAPASGNKDYWLGDGSTAGGKTSLDWDQDEGVFVWNGRTYYDVETLLGAIEDAKLTDSEMSTLQKKFKQFGFDLA